MIDERHEELAALHAFDLLEGPERARFEAALARDPELQALVHELRETAAQLARAEAAPPPAALKHRLLASLADRAAAAPIVDHVVRPAVFGVRQMIPWAIAAGLALVAAWLGARYLVTASEATLLRQQHAFADLALQGIRQQLEAERLVTRRQAQDLDRQLAAATSQLAPARADLGVERDLADYRISVLASLVKDNPQALAVALWDPGRKQGVLKVEKLPALAANQDYQLWVIDPQYKDPVDGGVFTVDPRTGVAKISFTARQPVNAVNAFAISLERKGGVPKAEGPVVLLGK